MVYLSYHLQRCAYGLRRWLGQQFTPMGLGVLVCLGITAIAGLGSIQSLMHLVFFLALALLLVAFLGRCTLRYAVRASRSLPPFGTVGEVLYYPVVLQNLTPTPQSGLKLVESLPEPFPSFREFQDLRQRYRNRYQRRSQWRRYLAKGRWALAPRVDLPPLSARQKTEVTGKILPLRRGRLQLPALALLCPDPLGLLYRRQTCPIAQSVCILPQRYQIPPLNLPNLRTYQPGEAVITSAVGESLEFRSLRDYRPGDPSNTIHWKSWAKLGRPVVKEQQEETALHHGLILDTFQTQTQSDLFEAAIAIAISILTQEQAEATLMDVMLAAPKPRYWTVGQGRSQQLRILETLATLLPCPVQTLHGLMPLVQARLPHLSGCLCILLSDDETRYLFVEQLVRHQIPTKVILLGDSWVYPQDRFDRFRSDLCQIHFVALSQLQQDLLQL